MKPTVSLNFVNNNDNDNNYDLVPYKKCHSLQIH